jgi:hypothetical protein
MRRLVPFLVVAVLVVSSLPVTGIASSTQGTYVSITDVTFTPEDPAPGETITIRSTVRNLEGSGSTLDIRAIAIRRSGTSGVGERERIEDLGTLAPGSSLEVPMTVSFEEPGTKRLRIHVYGTNERDQSVHVQYPAVIRVNEQHPQLDIEVNDTVASTSAQGQITVANGLASQARNVRISVTSTELDIDNRRAVFPTLDSGDTRRFRFSYESERPGTYFVNARLEYTVDGGQTRRVRETVPIEVEPFRENVVLEATTGPAGSETVAVDVLNRGNVPIENVTISGTSQNATVPQRLISQIPAQSSRSLIVNTSLDGERAAIRMRASYDMGPRHDTVTDGVVVRSTPGQIDLTGVNVLSEGGRLQITGSASNIGLTRANSVVVRVKETEAVTPAAPSREYFVGTVPRSDFVSFDVYARTTGNVSSIPLEVSYLVDGQRYTRTVRVPYDSGGSQGSDRPQQSGRGTLLPVAIGAVLVLGIASAIFVGWRKSRGGD